MKKLLLAIGVAVMATTGSAIAYDNNISAPDANATAPDRDESPSAAIRDEAPSQPGQRIVAQVLAVDPEAGKVLLATDAGMLPLDAPPEDLAQLKAGDHVIVMLPDAESDTEGVIRQ